MDSVHFSSPLPICYLSSMRDRGYQALSCQCTGVLDKVKSVLHTQLIFYLLWREHSFLSTVYFTLDRCWLKCALVHVVGMWAFTMGNSKTSRIWGMCWMQAFSKKLSLHCQLPLRCVPRILKISLYLGRSARTSNQQGELHWLCSLEAHPCIHCH